MLTNIDEIDRVDQFEPLNNLLVDIHDKKEDLQDAKTVQKLNEKLNEKEKKDNNKSNEKEAKKEQKN